MTLREEEKFYYHATAVAAGGDYATIRRARKNAASWRDVYGKFSPAGVSPEAAWEKLRKLDIGLILRDDPDFPPLLSEIPHPPFGLYIKGTLPPADQFSIAIVGTRRATPEGKNTARRFAVSLARTGFAIISGLAFGIDAAAQEGCLDADGKTVAVLACDPAHIYPRNNEPLARKILARDGAIISEYPPETPTYPSRFLERNRIVSGLSQGVLVIEAPECSGSLATARFALEQNRDVFVVPGPIAHPNFRGSHELIRQGAELVTKPEEILESYGVVKRPSAFAPQSAELRRGGEEQIILDFLASCGGTADIDKIIGATKLEPRIANRTLSFLLIQGLIQETENGYVLH